MVEEKSREFRQPDPSAEEPEESSIPSLAEATSGVSDSEMGTLKKLLDAAIEEENYEEAARLRDRIREMEST
jgi:excinuclease UvrABC nuclease subunit